MATSTYKSQVFCENIHFPAAFVWILAITLIINVNTQDIPDISEEGDHTTPSSAVFDSDSFEDEKDEIHHESIPSYSMKEKDFYSYSVYNIDGQLVSLEKYRGKVVLVVNVASECGFTDGHYKALIRLKNVLSNYKFEILAFPCNQFGAQEPGSDAHIKNWVEENYKANFPLFSKINVLDDHVPEAWTYLIGKTGKAPNWNFWKYLVNDQGRVIDAWGPRVPVEDLFHVIRNHIEAVPSMASGESGVSGESSEKVVAHGEL